MRWWDQRRGVDELRSAAESTACVGLICNEPNSWLLGMVPSRHWLAIRRIRGEWFDLDSRLQAPAKLEAAALIDRLQRLLRDEAGQILVVCQSAKDEDMVRLSGEVSKMSVGNILYRVTGGVCYSARARAFLASRSKYTHQHRNKA